MGHTHRYQFGFEKQKQVKSPSICSRVPETGSDPPIGSDRDSGRDIKYLARLLICVCGKFCYFWRLYIFTIGI